MAEKLSGKKVAFLATDGVEQVELTQPWKAVEQEGGEPDLISGFADVRAQLVVRSTGVVLWEAGEDVTDPERLPLASFTGDKQFTRHHLVEVLERAGQRLANELVYARSAGR